jgi:hypothetical protein
MKRFSAPVVWLIALTCCAWLHAASSALVVPGLAGSSQNEEEFRRLAGETKRLLVERGIPIDHVEVLGGKVTRETILQKLSATAASAQTGDEFWLVLYGASATSQNGVPAFQISGPRLTATDLKTALDAIKARQFVFVGTSNSGGLLPRLQNPNRTVLSATKGEGEGDLPRYSGMWVQAFAENPKASFARIAARAAALVDEEYKNASLAQSEHARLADPVTGNILEPPFGIDLAAAEVTMGDSGASSLVTASDIKVKMHDPNAIWEQQPATDETKKIVAEAKALPNPDGHAALMIEQRLGFTVEQDRTTDRLTFWRVYLAREGAVEEWANQFLPQSPPAVTSKLEIARVIQPDGSATIFNPAKLIADIDRDSGETSGSAMIFLPRVRAGCVIELGYRTRALLDATLPHVSEVLPLQRSIPVLRTSLEIRVPEKPVFRVALNNVSVMPTESSETGRHVYKWQLGAIAAAESLPGDPPWPQWVAHAAISSLPSWDEFAQWYRRLAKGSDAIDETVKKTATDLAAGSKSRIEKIQRDFEFVSALRYVAIEIGVQGFRPRTPAQVLANRYGDCKDKANLLVALLRCQGIDANFVLLNRGASTDVNFPSWQFNHAIASVPESSDASQPHELWLDSTDSVTPFGFVPPGDFGRAGLVFSKNKAEFETVAGNSTAISEIRDEWTLDQDAQGSWHGKFHRTATGLADDGLRRAFRGLTPAQRSMQLYKIVSQLWPAGDFSKGTVSDVSTLRNGVELRADVSAASGDLPRADAPGLDFFHAPSRDRPLLLNDQQPLALTQTVRLRYAKNAPEHLPEPFEAAAAGEKLSVTWERVDDHSATRTARLEFLKPAVPAEDYAALRQAIRGWNAALAH